MADKETQKESEGILVAVDGGTALVYICGRGSFKNSTLMKDFGRDALDHEVTDVVINMQACIGMDSTFMGVLAGLASRCRAKGGEVQMINLSPHTRGLLSTLGLDQLIRAYMAESTPKDLSELFLREKTELDELAAQEADKQTMAETMLEAHETLVDVCPENLAKFKDVLTYLREGVEDLKKSKSG
ncbi:MAG: anti-sigma factor antagonist [Spartobacteria bacterium]|nr:anti-sigma factor antagonist [Spartobacteria bacterium]